MRLSRSMVLVMVALTLAFAPGCRKKKKAPATEETAAAAEESEPKSGSGKNGLPKVRTVTVLPVEPRVTDDLKAKTDGSDPDGDNVTFTYQWYINGKKLTGEIGDSLPAGKAVHGDRVEVEALPSDGQESGESRRSSQVLVLNTPPKLVTEVNAGMSLNGFRMEVTDADNDPITYRLEGAPPNMTVDADGTLRWKPDPSDKAGEYKVTMFAEDGQGGQITIRFPIAVSASQNMPPTTGKVVSPAPGAKAVVPIAEPPAEPAAPRLRIPGAPQAGATPPPAP